MMEWVMNHLIRRTIKISYIFDNSFTIRFGCHKYQWRGTDKQLIAKVNRIFENRNAVSVVKIEANGQVLWEDE